MNWKIKAINAPALKKPYATKLLLILAAIMLIFAVLHLFRVDKLIPVVNQTFSESRGAVFVALVLIAEVFALPYLLQLKLSPAMRILSGLLVVLVPLTWTCFTIWTFGTGHSTGQFSSYISTPGSWWLVILNLGWLAVSYWALILSNFNKAWPDLKKKR